MMSMACSIVGSPATIDSIIHDNERALCSFGSSHLTQRFSVPKAILVSELSGSQAIDGGGGRPGRFGQSISTFKQVRHASKTTAPGTAPRVIVGNSIRLASGVELG